MLNVLCCVQISAISGTHIHKCAGLPCGARHTTACEGRTDGPLVEQFGTFFQFDGLDTTASLST